MGSTLARLARGSGKPGANSLPAPPPWRTFGALRKLIIRGLRQGLRPGRGELQPHGRDHRARSSAWAGAPTFSLVEDAPSTEAIRAEVVVGDLAKRVGPAGGRFAGGLALQAIPIHPVGAGGAKDLVLAAGSA